MSSPKAESKECSVCKRTLPLSEFHKRNGGVNILHASRCKKCRSTQHKERWKKNPREYTPEISAKIRKYWLKNAYGITPDDYNDMFIEQGGRCAICGKHQSEFGKRLCVDHCHETNEIRGLLCDRCNTGIAKFNDNINVLSNAIKYLGGE